jgi:hypothetical protein
VSQIRQSIRIAPCGCYSYRKLALCRTLQVLFSSGFEPNERLEGLVDLFVGADELAAHIGYAPIQILAAAALDASRQKGVLGDNVVFAAIIKLIAEVGELLVKNGARLSLDKPPTARSLMRAPHGSLDRSSSSLDSVGSDEGADKVDRSHLHKIQSNKQLEELLGMDRLAAAQMVWNSVKTINSTGNAMIRQDSKTAIEDSEAPGGSDEKSCAICWKHFGKIVNRKHRCRITWRHVCDECSSKRIIENGEEHRISDGQFMLARVDEVKKDSERLEAERKQESIQISHLPKSTAAARLERLEAEERAQRDSLFGGVMENISKAVFGDGETESSSAVPASEIGGLSAKLGQTRDALNERGEKLNTLADKSDRLVNASKDFASMAKELNRKSQSFW